MQKKDDYYQLLKVLELENIGYWTKEKGSDIMRFSEMAAQIIGLKTGDLSMKLNDFLGNVDSEDRPALENYINELSGEKDFIGCIFKMIRFNSEAKGVIYLSTRITNIFGYNNKSSHSCFG